MARTSSELWPNVNAPALGDRKYQADLLKKYYRLKKSQTELEDRLYLGSQSDARISGPEDLLVSRRRELAALRQEWAEACLERHILRQRLSQTDDFPWSSPCALDVTRADTPVVSQLNSPCVSVSSLASSVSPSGMRRSRSARLSAVHSQLRSLREKVSSQSAIESELETARKDVLSARLQYQAHKLTVQMLKDELSTTHLDQSGSVWSQSSYKSFQDRSDPKELKSRSEEQQAMIRELHDELRAEYLNATDFRNSVADDLREECQRLEVGMADSKTIVMGLMHSEEGNGLVERITQLEKEFLLCQESKEDGNQQIREASEGLTIEQQRGADLQNATHAANDEVQTLKVQEARLRENTIKLQTEIETGEVQRHSLKRQVTDVQSGCDAQLAAHEDQYSKVRMELAIASREFNMYVAEHAEEERTAAHLHSEAAMGKEGIGMLCSEIASIQNIAQMVEARAAEADLSMAVQLKLFRSQADAARVNANKHEERCQDLEETAREHSQKVVLLQSKVLAAEAEDQRQRLEIDHLQSLLRKSEEKSLLQQRAVEELHSRFNEMAVRASSLHAANSQLENNMSCASHTVEVKLKEVNSMKEAFRAEALVCEVVTRELHVELEEVKQEIHTASQEVATARRQAAEEIASFQNDVNALKAEARALSKGQEFSENIRTVFSVRHGSRFIMPGMHMDSSSFAGSEAEVDVQLVQSRAAAHELREELGATAKSFTKWMKEAKTETVAAQAAQVREELATLRASTPPPQLPRHPAHDVARVPCLGLRFARSPASSVSPGPVAYMQRHIDELEKLVSCMIHQRIEEQGVLKERILELEKSRN